MAAVRVAPAAPEPATSAEVACKQDASSVLFAKFSLGLAGFLRPFTGTSKILPSTAGETAAPYSALIPYPCLPTIRAGDKYATQNQLQVSSSAPAGVRSGAERPCGPTGF